MELTKLMRGRIFIFIVDIRAGGDEGKHMLIICQFIEMFISIN